MSKTYKIQFHPEALKEFCKLDGSVKVLVKKQLEKLQKSPLLGEELGNKNGYDLTGYRKMYVNKKQIRIVYSIKDEVLLINIISIGKREDMAVYANASKRV
jgi:mRNA interferase RelE/StbE